MGKAEPLVAKEYRALIECYSKLEGKLRSPNLTDEERAMCQLRALTIEGIFDALDLIGNKSEKQKLLLSLCLSGIRCSKFDISTEEVSKKYKSVDSIRGARNQLKYLLAATLFKPDKVTALIQSNSLQELEELVLWYANVLGSPEVMRLCSNH